MKVKEYIKYSKKNSLNLKNKNFEEIENEVWKELDKKSYIYGSDIPGSLMDLKSKWNFNNLDNILNKGLGKKLLFGINSPYIYFGSWKTFFPWHIEDLDLLSINYLHHGEAKFWYVIPSNQSEIVINYFRKKFDENYIKCNQFHRHKTILINPYFLKSEIPGLKITKWKQNKGEIIVTFSKSFHSGFNSGFNIAEAVNLAYYDWLKCFTSTKYCRCQKDNVKINIFEFYENLKKDKKLNKNNECFKHFQEFIKNKKNIENRKLIKSKSKKIKKMK